MEDYATFEQAKALKELGFDWECHYHYETNRLLAPNVKTLYYSMDIDSDDLCFDVNGHNIGDISAPTLAQAQKWLREVKGIEVGVFADFDIGLPNGKWVWIMRKFNTYLCDTIFPEDNINYDSYEQALSAGIDKALELLK